MKWIDYREALGIGISDKNKVSLLANKIAAFVQYSEENADYSMDDYYEFCMLTGIEYEDYVDASEGLAERFKEHSDSMNELLAYYIAFVNTLTDGDKQHRDELIEKLKSFLSDLRIAYEIVSDNDGLFVFPKGAQELDDALISAPLEWLGAYPTTRHVFIKALQNYSELTNENASDTADLLRKVLETFFHEFFGTDKTLENCKAIYGGYLKAHGVPKELASNFETLLQMYTTYMNAYAKHHDKAGKNVLEYIMYQTGNIIRLLITLKQDEK